MHTQPPAILNLPRASGQNRAYTEQSPPFNRFRAGSAWAEFQSAKADFAFCWCKFICRIEEYAIALMSDANWWAGIETYCIFPPIFGINGENIFRSIYSDQTKKLNFCQGETYA
ncbi:MAG: hypothetical protein D8M54_07140 [Chloroflexi bacterium]|nr:hypothetical protein [Chloroflexota bacterium]